jgi:hypothetical protein
MPITISDVLGELQKQNKQEPQGKINIRKKLIEENKQY